MIPRATLAAELAYLRGSHRVPVHFQLGGGRLRLSAQADARLLTSLEAEGAGEAWLCVNELYEWLRFVEDEHVTVRFTRNAAVFAHKTGAVKIPTMAVNPPEYLDTPVLAEMRLPSEVASAMVRAVAMAQTNGFHAYIDGLLFEAKANVFTIGASNGVLLGAVESVQESPDFRTILGEPAVAQMVRTIRDGAQMVTLRLHERAVSFLCGPRETTIGISGGTRFPPFQKFLPKGTFRLDAKTEDVLAALTAVVTPAKDVHAVAFGMTASGDLRFTVDDSSAEIACFGALPAMKVSAADLRVIVKALESERVEFLCDGPTTPFAIRPLGLTAVYMMSPVTK